MKPTPGHPVHPKKEQLIAFLEDTIAKEERLTKKSLHDLSPSGAGASSSAKLIHSSLKATLHSVTVSSEIAS
jgi:hypothetical protein